MCVHFLAGVGTPKRKIWKTPFRCVETVAEINECCPVTAFLRSFGNARAQEGTRSNSRELIFQSGGVVQLVGTPACHAGGRGSSPVAPAKSWHTITAKFDL